MFPEHKTPAIAGAPTNGVSGLKIDLTKLFGGMDAGAKYLAERYPVPLVVWARFFFNVLIMLVFLGPVYGRRLVRTRRPGMQLVRGIAWGLSSMLFVSALPYLR